MVNNHKYFIKSIFRPAADVVVLEIGNKNGEPVFDFRPGQYAMISYKNKKGAIEDKHAFSIASSPSEKNRITFAIKILGEFTQGLAKLSEGEEIFVSAPFGKFFFDEKRHKHAVFMAGGIGITPFLSAIRYATDNNLPNKISLIYSNKTVSGTLFLKEIKELEERNSNFQSLISITEQKIPADINGVINGRVDKEIIRKFVGNTEGADFFMCGPIPFMRAMENNLTVIGVDRSRMESEEFSMIPDSGFWPIVKNTSYAVGISAVLITLPLYLIYGSAEGATLRQSYKKIFPIGGSADLREAALKAYKQRRQNVAFAGNFLKPVNDEDSDDLEDSKNDSVATINTKAKKESASSKIISKLKALTPVGGNLIPAGTGTAVSGNQVSSAPNPTTSASIPAEETPTVAASSASPVPQSNTNTNTAASAPTPTTSASSATAAASTSPTQASVSSNTPNASIPGASTISNSSTTPAPTTSASTIAEAGPTSGSSSSVISSGSGAASSNNGSASNAGNASTTSSPTPTTSASGVAVVTPPTTSGQTGSTSASSSGSVSSGQQTTVSGSSTPVLGPVTSASGVVSSSAPTSSGSTISSSGSVQTPPTTTRRSRDRDDEEYDD